MIFSRPINIIAGKNGAGKTILLNEIYKYLSTRKSEILSEVESTFSQPKIFYVRQNDLILRREKIYEIIKEYTEYNLVKSNIENSLNCLNLTDEMDENLFRLKMMKNKVTNNMEKYQKFKSLTDEKEKIENYLKSKESKKLFDKIVEVQDQIAAEENVLDNFENDAFLLKKEHLEKEIQNLKSQIENEENLIERKKILWREEMKIKEKIKKYRNDRRVINLIEFDPEITNAIIAVLGNKLKAKVVQYENEALEEIENLKFRQSYLCLEKIETNQNNTDEENIDTKKMIPMKKLIKTKAEYNILKDFLFKDVFIVEKLDFDSPNKILVTLNGQVQHKSGAISGGYEENFELKQMISEKENYKKGVNKLKEIENELKKVSESSIADTKKLILKIIESKEEEVKKIKVSKKMINYNLEKLKILLKRLIDQKNALNFPSDFQINQNFENENLHEKIGNLNKEIKKIMINQKIDYNEIFNKIEDLIKRNKELEEDKKKLQKLAQDLTISNEEFIKNNTDQVLNRVLYFFQEINGKELHSSEIESEESKSSSLSTNKENNENNNFNHLLNKVKDRDETNFLLRKISNLSGGQLQMLTIALVLSLHEIIQFDVILLDEIDSNLDDTKNSNLRNILSKLKAQVFQISHRKTGLSGNKFFWLETEKVEEISHNELLTRLV